MKPKRKTPTPPPAQTGPQRPTLIVLPVSSPEPPAPEADPEPETLDLPEAAEG